MPGLDLVWLWLGLEDSVGVLVREHGPPLPPVSFFVSVHFELFTALISLTKTLSNLLRGFTARWRSYAIPFDFLGRSATQAVALDQRSLARAVLNFGERLRFTVVI